MYSSLHYNTIFTRTWNSIFLQGSVKRIFHRTDNDFDRSRVTVTLLGRPYAKG